MSNERTNERLQNYKDRLALYYKAEQAILEGAQSYSIGSRHLTRADLAEIRKMIKTLEEGVDEMAAEASGRSRRKCVRVIPMDV